MVKWLKRVLNIETQYDRLENMLRIMEHRLLMLKFIVADETQARTQGAFAELSASNFKVMEAIAKQIKTMAKTFPTGQPSDHYARATKIYTDSYLVMLDYFQAETAHSLHKLRLIKQEANDALSRIKANGAKMNTVYQEVEPHLRLLLSK